MPYLLFLKKRQNLKLSSAAHYRWHFKGLELVIVCLPSKPTVLPAMPTLSYVFDLLLRVSAIPWRHLTVSSLPSNHSFSGLILGSILILNLGTQAVSYSTEKTILN